MIDNYEASTELVDLSKLPLSFLAKVDREYSITVIYWINLDTNTLYLIKIENLTKERKYMKVAKIRKKGSLKPINFRLKSSIVSPYRFWSDRLFSKDHSTINIYEDTGLDEMVQPKQNSFMHSEEKVYTQILSQEKFRRGCLNKKGNFWDGYPLRLFLQVLNYSGFASISIHYKKLKRSGMI